MSGLYGDPAYADLTDEERDAVMDRAADRCDGTPHDAAWVARVQERAARAALAPRTGLVAVQPSSRPNNDDGPALERRAA